MNVLFVVDRAHELRFELPGAATVSAREYLTDPSYANASSAHLVNLCRTDRYQGRGYYVSLLAAARGHAPLPDVQTIEALQARAQPDAEAAELAALAQRTLPTGHGPRRFELAVYFGRDAAERHDALARRLFELLPAPLLRARFQRCGRRWRLLGVRAMAAAEVPASHRRLLLSAATQYMTRHGEATGARPARRHCVAILCDPDEPDPPSDPQTLERFQDAARALGLDTELIGPDAFERLRAFSGLFLRATTNVAHYTYAFARRASRLGLVVIDDPDSILKCTNKVFLNELMARHHIPTPKTLAVHRGNLDRVVPALGLPCILKQPDGAFSLGVAKIETERQLRARAAQLFERSELLIAQEWLPTEFDWRVCVLDRRPLLVCRYYMAPGHWQVIKRESALREEGAVDTLSVADTPQAVVDIALRAANLIGDGFYGVDLKQVGGQCYLIEVNDNPSIETGYEDRVLQAALYREVMGVFARRIDAAAAPRRAR